MAHAPRLAAWPARQLAAVFAAVLAGMVLAAGAAMAAAAASDNRVDSQPGVDAPELAPLGPHAVGVRSISLVEPAVPDVLAFDPVRHAAPLRDRTLAVDVWYPAHPAPQARRVVYSGALDSESGAPKAFEIAGVAVRDALADQRGGPYPLVVLSHGYGGTPVAMSWLAENLASKGYVVVAAHHVDPPYGDGAKFVGPLLLRPLDIAFLAHAVQTRTRRGDAVFAGLVDPGRVALAGYSMGGYGVLTVAGAGLSPQAAQAVPGGYLAAYARGGPKAGALRILGLKAVVAISPAGGGGRFAIWDDEGLRGLAAPTLLIVGSQDKTVSYAAVRSIFERAVGAPRDLLVLKEAGHSIGMDAAPASMRAALWDQDWFEDPVWRKERVIGVELHFITAFLDLNVKGDRSRAGYLDLDPDSDDGVWAAPPPGAPYAAYSPGPGPGPGAITVWKGFQRDHVAGLRFERKAAGP